MNGQDHQALGSLGCFLPSVVSVARGSRFCKGSSDFRNATLSSSLLQKEQEGCWTSISSEKTKATIPSEFANRSVADSPQSSSSTKSSNSTSYGDSVLFLLQTKNPNFFDFSQSLSFSIFIPSLSFFDFRSIRAQQPAEGLQSHQQGGRPPQDREFLSILFSWGFAFGF